MYSWLRGSLRWKLVAAAGLIQITMLALLLVNSTRLFNTTIEEQGKLRIQEISPLLNAALAPALFRRDYSGTQEIVDSLLRSANRSLAYLIIMDDRGRVFSKSGQVDTAPATVSNPRADDPIFHGSLPLRIGSERVGELRYGLSNAVLIDARATLLRQGALIAMAGFVLTLVGLMAIGVWLTRDVGRLVSATRAIAAGRYEVRATIQSRDEIGQLAQHFNAMGDSLNASLRELLIKQAAIESSLNGIAMAGMDGKITYVNPAFLRLWRLESAEQAIGHLPSEFASEAGMIIESAQREGEWQGEQQVKRPDGSTVDFYIMAHVVKDKSDQPVCLMASFQDITARKRAEAALKELNRDLEGRVERRTAQLTTANQALESFSYSVAHDLRAPLRGIDGYSQLLLTDHAGKLDDEGRRFLQKIRLAAQQMGQLIDDILAYSRLERAELQASEVYPRELVESLLAERDEDIRTRGVAVDVNFPCAAVTADRDGLTMALRNLLENALKFSRAAPTPRIEIGGRDTGATCILSVRDNGTGFDMKYHDRIFDIFERLHRSEDYPGTGVGLALVKKAMVRMGGRVWAESEPGKGATFYLEIPK